VICAGRTISNIYNITSSKSFVVFIQFISGRQAVTVVNQTLKSFNQII